MKKMSTGMVAVLLILELVPLILLPITSFKRYGQEWWLPLLLVIFSIFSLVQIIVRKTTVLWPWNLLSLCQGINIISRLMLIIPHATVKAGDGLAFNFIYVLLAVISIAASFWFIVFNEKPEVRIAMLPKVGAE
ncbi:MAG TPA: hypothetical protein PKD55_13050 [Bellilinea sp.]|nr:hypothetical protein [Bellilinea sp.]